MVLGDRLVWRKQEEEYWRGLSVLQCDAPGRVARSGLVLSPAKPASVGVDVDEA